MAHSGKSFVRQNFLDAAQGRLTSANVGDSGFVVVGTTPYRSALQVMRTTTPVRERGWLIKPSCNEV